MFQKKVAHEASSFTPAKAPADAITKAAHAPVVGHDPDSSMEMQLPDHMTKIPKLAGHPAVAEAHAHNTKMHTQRFGTDTEKAKMKSDCSSNYGGAGSDCPSY